ncbi:hypothetical protein AMK59_7616 [Oryctes borbonicus]|uniref:Uncharacterized protein n=1 Tax=Oryctes borbonicus TaxID=1629725 RepID=A0A0T6AZF1_9SCAR|nr:hypothetical protein AMK59_7616 [Oryctes borbonicus]
MMSLSTDLQPVYINPPSYIREITKSSENIYLFSKHVQHSSNTEDDTKQSVEDTNISLDLTGNPLPIDLSGDVSFLALEEQIWSQADNNHHPLPLETVRRLINKVNKESCHGNATVYGVCDGTDKKCTLALGAWQTDDYLSRIEICNLGCFYQSDVQISLEKMLECHYDNIGKSKCEVKSLINATYAIGGNNLRNYKISNTLPCNSCILYNVSWNTYQYKVPEFVQFAEMTLQTVIGHKESELYIFWEQFMMLKMYTVLLVKTPADLENIILSDDPKNYVTICEDICCLLQEMTGARKVILKKELKDKLDVNSLRQEDLIDKLWRILICKLCKAGFL